MAEIQDGAQAQVYRALNTPRLLGGVIRTLAICYWGIFSIPILSAPLPKEWRLGILIVAALGHAGLAYRGREDPYWLLHLRRKWRHGDVATSYVPRTRAR